MEVFAYHLIETGGKPFGSALVAHGHEAVILFFVLSGFVISYTLQEREKTIGNFVTEHPRDRLRCQVEKFIDTRSQVRKVSCLRHENIIR
jgi:hypothetical protein